MYARADGVIDPDVDGALRPLTAEIEKLDPQRERVRQVFVVRGVEPSATDQAIGDVRALLLADEKPPSRVRRRSARAFLATFDTVLPRPEALPYVEDATLFGEIQIRNPSSLPRHPRRRLRSPTSTRRRSAGCMDKHITALDLSQQDPSRSSITAPEFAEHISGQIGSAQGQGVGDGARRALPHPRASRRGPRLLREALASESMRSSTASRNDGSRSRLSSKNLISDSQGRADRRRQHRTGPINRAALP